MATHKLIQDLNNLLTEGILSQEDDDLKAHETDTWPLRMVEKTIGHVLEGPLCVIKPANTAEVSKILTYLNEHKVPVVPYGRSEERRVGKECRCHLMWEHEAAE